MQKSFHLLGSLCACAIGLSTLTGCGGSANGDGYAPNMLTYFSEINIQFSDLVATNGSAAPDTWFDLGIVGFIPKNNTDATLRIGGQSITNVDCTYFYNKTGDNEATLSVDMYGGSNTGTTTLNIYSFVFPNVTFNVRNKATSTGITITRQDRGPNVPLQTATGKAYFTCFSSADINK